MSYTAAVDHLYALGHELAVSPGTPRRKFDLIHMRILAAIPHYYAAPGTASRP